MIITRTFRDIKNLNMTNIRIRKMVNLNPITTNNLMIISIDIRMIIITVRLVVRGRSRMTGFANAQTTMETEGSTARTSHDVGWAKAKTIRKDGDGTYETSDEVLATLGNQGREGNIVTDTNTSVIIALTHTVPRFRRCAYAATVQIPREAYQRTMLERCEKLLDRLRKSAVAWHPFD